VNTHIRLNGFFRDLGSSAENDTDKNPIDVEVSTETLDVYLSTLYHSDRRNLHYRSSP